MFSRLATSVSSRVFLGLVFLGPALYAAKVVFKPAATAKKLVSTVEFLSFAKRDAANTVVNDTMSKNGVDNLLRALDPSKSLLLQADVDAFRTKWLDKLDDELREGSLEAIQEISQTVLQRFSEKTALVVELTQTTPDFSVKETYDISDEGHRTYPADAAELRERVRKSVKYGWLLQREAKVADDKIGEVLRKRQVRSEKRLASHFGDEEKLFAYFASALIGTLDPHSTFMTAAEGQNLMIHLRGNLEGIGASLSGEEETVTVANIVKGGAAELEGSLKPKDAIIGVAQGETGEFVDTASMDLQEVVTLIRGEAGSVVRLRVVAGTSAPREITLKRKKITLEDAKCTKKAVDVKHADGAEIKVGLIQIPSFYTNPETGEGLTKDVRELLAELVKQGIESLVVDLRDNGGGSLNEVVDLTGMFIDVGTVVQVRSPGRPVELKRDRRRGMEWTGPLLVLTNRHSASASEIFAGAIKAYRRGVVVGDVTTHGKGTVQTVLDLAELKGGPFGIFPISGVSGLLKMTIQQFYLPDGVSTQEDGVASQVILPSIYNNVDRGESMLTYHITRDKIDPSPDYKTLSGYWQESYAPSLNKASESRRSKSAEFQAHLAKAKKVEEAYSRKAIPLEQSDFAKLIADSKFSVEGDEDEAGASAAKEKTDAQLDEGLQIAADYYELLSRPEKL